jgi:uncharacterized protein YciU (UPF0263 family)
LLEQTNSNQIIELELFSRAKQLLELSSLINNDSQKISDVYADLLVFRENAEREMHDCKRRSKKILHNQRK